MGRLYQLDAELGWRTLPNLDVDRRNPAGEPWRIRTDVTGSRILPEAPDSAQTILIMGDSFAFGEGVDIEDRFDVVMAPLLGGPRLINIGAGGYGADQEWIAARPHLSELGEGDVVLVLLYKNDFYDVLRQRFALRAKPYFASDGRGFALVAPQTNWLDHLRDRSYLAALAGRALEPSESASWDFDQARAVIRHILTEVRREAPPRTRVVLAYHGFLDADATPAGALTGMVFCDAVDLCVDLDPPLSADSGNYLPDRHWTARGHHVVGEILAREIAAPSHRPPS
jgi:hypothetical protein